MNSAYGENEYSILRQVLGLLYRNNDFDAAVNDVLELLGKTYQVSRVYYRRQCRAYCLFQYI